MRRENLNCAPPLTVSTPPTTQQTLPSSDAGGEVLPPPPFRKLKKLLACTLRIAAVSLFDWESIFEGWISLECNYRLASG